VGAREAELDLGQPGAGSRPSASPRCDLLDRGLGDEDAVALPTVDLEPRVLEREELGEGAGGFGLAEDQAAAGPEGEGEQLQRAAATRA
jgi:hypothetical protein